MIKSTFSLDNMKVARLSKLFQPITVPPKDAPKCESKLRLMSKSQKLLHDLGIVRQANSGIFHLLPLGLRSIRKLKHLVRNHLNKIGANEIKMPLVIDGDLWKKSGRWDEVDTDIFKMKDRHRKDCLLSPTNEESAAELVSSLGQLTHHQLPLVFYQMASKFRDELKPRCGLIRAREFDMMDAYSFDTTKETSLYTYNVMSAVFANVFKDLAFPYFRVKAQPGHMGGDVSHEFHILSDVGEDEVRICKSCSFASDTLQLSSTCPSCGSSSLQQATGIEVGHTFLLGTRYSVPLDCMYRNEAGQMVPLFMGSYGLGLTRIMAASLELLSSEEEIRWPSAIAPFLVCIIPPKEGSKEWAVGYPLCLEICKHLEKLFGNDIILDDRCTQTIGRRIVQARRTGYPYIICLGKSVTGNPPLIELLSLVENKKEFLTLPNLLMFFENSERCKKVVEAIG